MILKWVKEGGEGEGGGERDLEIAIMTQLSYDWLTQIA
jgi:hypothetical protein